ncbi:MAG: hypothetical protein ACK5OB_00575 [Pirellula sp.]
MTEFQPRSSYQTASAVVRLVGLALVLFGVLHSQALAGCGPQSPHLLRDFLRSAPSHAAMPRSGAIGLEMYLEYRGGAMGFTHLPPSTPCDEAGCKTRHRMQPNAPVESTFRLVLSTGNSTVPTESPEFIQDPKASGVPASEFADRGGLGTLDHPPKSFLA